MTYIAPQAKVFRHLDRVLGWQQGAKPAPVTVEWDLSNRCYLGCHDCHFAHTHTRGPWASRDRLLPMAYETTGDLADPALVSRVLGELQAAGVKGVIWSGGGEPTLHPDWRTIVAETAAVGLRQGMYTAGGLLSSDDARLLGMACSWVVVSLDALDAASYAREKQTQAFEAACRGVRALAETGCATGVSFLLTSANWQQADAMLELSRSLRATYTTFRPAIRTAPTTPSVCDDDRVWIRAARSLLARLAEQPDVEIDPARFEAYRTWAGHGYTDCLGVRLNTTITPDGRVWICPQRRGVTALGDLRRESFASIWARHPGRYVVDDGCRVMCRLHPVNAALDALERPRVHEAFV